LASEQWSGRSAAETLRGMLNWKGSPFYLPTPGLLPNQRLQKNRVNPEALAGLAQQCVRMVDDRAAQTHLGDRRALGYAGASRITVWE
jgi:hypothetical protein